mmetsp:Transcript_90193/g.156302  ORF Transcript_90193/g.156302 Transcript_90193/m.156302 type:complete len:505 (-) Transcript_90193:207-1721(-)
MIAKAKLAAAAMRAAKLGRCARAWRSLAAAMRLEREAAMHMEQRMREQRLAILSVCHYEQRLWRRSLVAWQAFLRHVRDERVQELLNDRARQFIKEQAEEEQRAPPMQQGTGNPEAAKQQSPQPAPPPRQPSPAAARSPMAPQQQLPQQAAAAKRQSPLAARSPEQPPQPVVQPRQASAARRAEEGQQPPQQAAPRRRRDSPPAATASPESAEHQLIELSSGEADQPTPQPQLRRPRVVLEMERRAEVHQRMREERRERHLLREEQRLAAVREAEEAQRLAQEQEKRQQLLERRERQRSEQLRKAERLVEQAQQRQKMRQAHEFWVQNRLADCWCALRQATIEAEELQLAAWFRYRRSLLLGTLMAWKGQQLRDAVAREASSQARIKLADSHARRWAFRTVLSVLRQLAKCELEESAAARNAVLLGRARHCVQRWHQVAADSSFQKGCMALRQYAKWLMRQTLACWVLGAQQSRLDRDLELHKQALREKVFGWLREIDSSSAVA